MPFQIGFVTSSIFRSQAGRSIRRFGGQRSVLIACLGIFISLVQLTGCHSIQTQLARESEKCGALCNRARQAREQGNPAEANRYIDEALRHRPNDAETRLELAETLWKSGRRNEAIDVATFLYTQHPKDARLAARLATMQWENKQHAEAALTAMATLQLDPESKEAWRIKARMEMEHGQVDAALDSYLQLSQLAPGDFSTTMELASLHLKRGNPDRACPLLRSAMQHAELTAHQRGEIEWQLGLAYAQNQRWSMAIPVLERAINQRSATAEDWCLLGWSRFHGGDLNGAQTELKRALACDPQSVAAQALARNLQQTMDSGSDKYAVLPTSHLESR